MYIYVITNLVNNKKYVGQTTKTIQGKIFSPAERLALSTVKNKSSKFLGVLKIPKSNYWRAECYYGGKRKHAVFNTEEDAAHAYDYFLVSFGLQPIHFPEEVWTEVFFNSKTRKKERKSSFFGVVEYNDHKFQAMVFFNKKRRYLGTFKLEEEAKQTVINFLRDNDIKRLEIHYPEEIISLEPIPA